MGACLCVRPLLTSRFPGEDFFCEISQFKTLARVYSLKSQGAPAPSHSSLPHKAWEAESSPASSLPTDTPPGQGAGPAGWLGLVCSGQERQSPWRQKPREEAALVRDSHPPGPDVLSLLSAAAPGKTDWCSLLSSSSCGALA